MSDPHADPAPSTGHPSPAEHAGPGPGPHHAASIDAGAGHGGHDAHGGEHGTEEALGPVDFVAWGAGLLGVVVGLGMALAFAIATNRLGA